MTDKSDSQHDLDDPEIMFLPLAAVAGDGWHGLDAGVFARRIPDFVHQVLNQGQVGPSAMLELQTASESGPVTWVEMETAPDRDEAFEFRRHWQRQLNEGGWAGISWPKEYGGRGATLIE